jgi:anti-sigma-K factor RskA
MNYGNEGIRNALAAEYVLGTLRGSARRRFARSLKGSPGLRRAVAAWGELLAPLNDRIEAIVPPARVWRRIQNRIGASSTGRARRADFWLRVGFWRTTAVASPAAALVLAGWVFVLAPSVESQEMMVAVLSDRASAPALVVSWAVVRGGPERLRVRVIRRMEQAPDTTWQLWMLPANGEKPVSLGLISGTETQVMSVPAGVAAAVNAARGLVMSVEPPAGSPSGLPTGPVLYSGPCTLL